MQLFFDKLKDRARVLHRRIVFAEGDDSRVIAAARRLNEEGLADPILISKSSVAGVETVDPANSPRLLDYAAFYHRRRAAKGVTEAEADAASRRPLYFAALMV